MKLRENITCFHDYQWLSILFPVQLSVYIFDQDFILRDCHDKVLSFVVQQLPAPCLWCTPYFLHLGRSGHMYLRTSRIVELRIINQLTIYVLRNSDSVAFFRFISQICKEAARSKSLSGFTSINVWFSKSFNSIEVQKSDIYVCT